MADNIGPGEVELGCEKAATTMQAASPVRSLRSLSHLALWVVWRNELRNGKKTKIPYNPRGGMAKADDPATWTMREEAEAALPGILNGMGGGLGLELAEIGGSIHLGGIDLDTCRDPTTGVITSWAQEVLSQFTTYAEVSPSRTGVKLFFLYRLADQNLLREAMGTQYGKLWQRGGTEHPPAIELHIAHRYFAVTGERLANAPETLQKIPVEALLWLIRTGGPAFKAATDRSPQVAVRSYIRGNDILDRLSRAATCNSRVAQVLERISTYGSRSEAAMALGSALKDAGWSFSDMWAALAAHEATALWTAEKGEAADQRELRRIWTHAASPLEEQPEWSEPDMCVLRLNRRPPPQLPLEAFGAWGSWIIEAARAAAAPPDYVGCTLLSVGSVLVGNARWPRATPGWREPPHLWVGCVGDSGSNKSSGADCLLRDVVPVLEKRVVGDFADRRAEWQAKSEAARAAAEKWQNDVRAAVKDGQAPPAPPAAAPPEPQVPRLLQSDVTVEKMASLLAHAAPKGLLVVRDEMAGWLLGQTTYNDAGRAFWIEAYGGRPYRVERQRHPEPIDIPRLAVAVCGGTQPEKLAEMFRDADDGLFARILWTWPEPLPFRISRVSPRREWATAALDRLRLLELAPDENGDCEPVDVPLAEAAIPLIERFGQDMQAAQQEAAGLMRSAYGKARGLALRISLVLAMLRWCGEDGFAPPPTMISEADLAAACDLVKSYFMPMAERVYGDAAANKAERNAATLARWIMKARPREVHVRKLQREVRLAGLGSADLIHAAAEVLIEAGWLHRPPKGGFQTKAKGIYPINPILWEAAP